MKVTAVRLQRAPRMIALLVAAVMALAVRTMADDLKVGEPAPDFSLKASDGRTYSLSMLRGKTVVLAWFPKAFTSG